ncbi:hypothetical protein NYP83_09220 [Erwinia pyrifoliae]|uniref:Uncharacterized protein n=1 Tax=Erwinia pyrifoliae TaxID=79967 RepID=A0ABY5XE56_ERWPY|nr:hypothetical protein [Erwinia pyrifoliae]MCU8587080.1 hypothetical protein [Erwinia pyrifoliae]UWS30944.1 hypothetical protein NYP81_05660 [Erwinia pyrifoliae]UWS35258.1 hypothetical protein NYP84_09020 [Erwinia pyrifoliae]
MNHAITPVSNHSSAYRGFTITKLPRKALQPVTRYQVIHGDQSFGKFDAQAEATHYIDSLYQQRGAYGIRPQNVIKLSQGKTL